LTYIDNNSNSFKIQYDASADIANIYYEHEVSELMTLTDV